MPSELITTTEPPPCEKGKDYSDPYYALGVIAVLFALTIMQQARKK